MSERDDEQALRIMQETLSELGWEEAFNPLQFGVTFSDGEQFMKFCYAFAIGLRAAWGKDKFIFNLAELDDLKNRLNAELGKAQKPVAWQIRTPAGTIIYEDSDPRHRYSQEWLDNCYYIIPLYAAPVAKEPAQDMVLVPREPTEEILLAMEGVGEYDYTPKEGESWRDYQRACWKMILLAASKEPQK